MEAGVPTGICASTRLSILAAWGDVHQTKARHVIPYTDLGTCRKSMQAAYWLTQAVSARQVLGYDVTNVDPVAAVG